MADKTIDSELIIAISQWPDGVVLTCGSQLPFSSFTNAVDHNVAAATMKLGMMIRVYNDGDSAGVDGWSTMMYGWNDDTIAAARELCQPSLATAPYKVSSTVASAIIVNDISMLMAVSISAMTAEYYGWFWVDGVAPESHIAAMGGDYPTSNDVIIGPCVLGAGAGAKGVLELLTSGTLDTPCAYSYAVDAS